jgi:hypothetical protein
VKDFTKLAWALVDSARTFYEDGCTHTVVDNDKVTVLRKWLEVNAPKPPPPKTWRDDPVTSKQLETVRNLRGYDGPDPKTKGEATDILNRFLGCRREPDYSALEDFGPPREWGDL